MNYLAVELNIDNSNDFPKNKWLYWTNNKYNEFLHSTINKMVELEILEKEEDENLIRFNLKFDIK